VSPWSKRSVNIPPPAMPGFMCTESIKALGVTISPRFSVIEHVDNLLAFCEQTLCAMRTLQTNALHASYQATMAAATMVAKLSYASPSWWEYANTDNKVRLEAFPRRSSCCSSLQ